MDPIQLLTEDHEKVKGLFRQYEQATDAQQQQQIARTVFTELQIHSALEKELFYPAVAQKGDADEKALVDHSYHDHAVVEQLIGELQAMRPADPQFDTKFAELRGNVLEHAQEEEERMFPDARTELGDDLMALGDRMQARKRALSAGAS
jgi:hemerythrin superfamily protein